MEQTLEQNKRSSQERERQVLIAQQVQKQLEKCALCQYDMKPEEKILKIQPCKHPFHLNCFTTNTLLQGSKQCPLCREQSFLLQEDFQDIKLAGGLEKTLMDMVEAKGWFTRPEVVQAATQVQLESTHSETRVQLPIVQQRTPGLEQDNRITPVGVCIGAIFFGLIAVVATLLAIILSLIFLGRTFGYLGEWNFLVGTIAVLALIGIPFLAAICGGVIGASVEYLLMRCIQCIRRNRNHA